jgi:DNA-binding CsgD family transcriptional regulator
MWDAWLAGHASHMRALLDRAEPLVDDPLSRADLALARARIEEGQHDPVPSLIAAARAVEDSDPTRAAMMLCWAHDWVWDACRMEDARAIVERAWRLVGRMVSPATIVVATAVAWQRLSDMHDDDSLALARQTLHTAVQFADPEGLYNAAFCAQLLVYAEEHAAHEGLDALINRAQELGALHCSCWALIARSELQLREGRLSDAYAAAAEALTIAELLGGYQCSHAAAALAHVEGIMGRADDCEQHATLAIEQTPGDLWVEAVARRARGVLALGVSDLDTAVQELDVATSLVAAVQHPGFLDCHSDHVEALLRHGETDQAGVRLAELESRATKAGLHRTVAISRRCRALSASDDRLDDAFTQAISSSEHVSPLDEARARLCYGERLRRGGRRADSRVHLRAALETFVQLGAKPWAEHASRELRASGSTIRRRDPFVHEQLTPQELQIAITVAQGKTNREIGAAFFISPKTVEKHLSSAYRKLGIRSRAELIRLQLTQPLEVTHTPSR